MMMLIATITIIAVMMILMIMMIMKILTKLLTLSRKYDSLPISRYRFHPGTGRLTVQL